MRIFLIGIILLALSGCSNKQYEMYKSPCANLENLQKGFKA